MSGNRKAAEGIILELISKLVTSDENITLYKNFFASMNDKQFDEFIVKLEEKKIRLPVIVPNFGKSKVTIENNLKLAEELGHNFFERIWMKDGDDSPAYLSPIKYLIVDLPLRRQAQLLVKKISIPEDNKSIDDMTGQPTGKSKGSKISYPEIQILAALNLTSNMTELLKYRGGDVKGYQAMNAEISKTGGVSLNSIKHLGTTVKSTQTLKTLLTSMHLESTGLIK